MTKLRGMCIVFVAAALSTSVAAETIANGPYYATPSWDQSLPASTRFIVLANFNGEAVLDRETGLVWQRAVNRFAGTYVTNYDSCLQEDTGNHLGWRLPTLPELGTLFDTTVAVSPGIPVGHPFTGFPTGPLISLSTSTFFANGNNAAVSYGPLPNGVNSVGNGAIGPTGAAYRLCVRSPGATVR
jgi:hypothetical protein